jgi:hypothetical protein
MASIPVGIGLSAVLTVLGSVVTLLLAGAMLFTLFISPSANGQMSPTLLKAVTIVMAAVFTALSGWGIATAIGIFTRRGWARISIIVFAALLTLMSAGGALSVAVMPFPPAPGLDPSIMTTVRLGIVAFYAVLTGIGVWWLVLFNRSGARNYFAWQEPVRERAQPLSVMIIAWWLIGSSVLMAPSVIFRFPAVLMGVVLTGLPAMALYVVFATAQLWVGTSLLGMRRTALIGAIAYFTFAAVNGIVSLIGPAYPEMVRQVKLAMPKLFPAGIPEMSGPMWPYAFMSAAFCAVPIFFLVQQRPRFH